MEKLLKNECKPENYDDYDGGGDDGIAMMIVMLEKDKEGLWQRSLCKFVRQTGCMQNSPHILPPKSYNLHQVTTSLFRNNAVTSLKSQNRIPS